MTERLFYGGSAGRVRLRACLEAGAWVQVVARAIADRKEMTEVVESIPSTFHVAIIFHRP
jgi:siroheme synthase (precorrin-2 oxidase/ferrochelatase)